MNQEDYKQPLLRIRLPIDEPPVDPQLEQDRKTDPASATGRKRPAAPLDPRVRIIAGATTPLELGATRQFQALTYDLADTRITWSISHGVGEIDQQGLYTAPAEMPEDPYVTVRAASTPFPELYDERTFRLAADLQSLTLRIVNTCGQVPAGGANCHWTITSVGVTHQEAAVAVPAGETGEQESLPVNPMLMGPVILHLVWPLAEWNGDSTVDILATRVDDTTYEVDLCSDDPEWTYFNVQQSYTASCPSGTFGAPVTVTKNAGTFSSTTSVAAANALALAAAQAEAEAGLSCSTQTLLISADALDAKGKILVTFVAPGLRGHVDWTVTIGAVRRPNGSGGYLDPGNFIKPTELGTPYLAENLTYHTNIPDASAVLDLVFYFETIDPRWLIGNSDGSTWLIDVTAAAVSTDPAPDVVLTQTWKKYLLI